jgi:hypothetical protein
MSNKDGRIMISGDYEGDLKAIVDSLNSLRWSFRDSDGEQQEWVVEHRSVEKFSRTGTREECEIIVLNGNIRCPSLRPMGHFLVLKNGRRCFADDAESFIEWKADGALAWDRCTLKELYALISPHLNKGTIEFVAVHASRGYVSHERLLIDADGRAEWDNCYSHNCSGLDRWTRRETERYPLMDD